MGEPRKFEGEAARALSKAIADQAGAIVDPRNPGLEGLDPEALESGQALRDFVANAHEQGCTCDPLEVELRRIPTSMEGQKVLTIEMLGKHNEGCPFVEALEAERR